MKQKYIIAFLLLFAGAHAMYAQRWDAQPTAVVGKTYTYMYDDGTADPNSLARGFSISGPGVEIRRYISGMEYSIQITWTSPGKGTVYFNGNPYQVTIVEEYPTPNATFTITEECGRTIIRRLQSPPAGVTWYWQTTSNGVDLNFSGDTYIIQTSTTMTSPLYLRAMSTGWGYSQSVGTIRIYSGLLVAPAVAYDGRGFSGSSPTMSVSAVSGATGYHWYSQATGSTSILPGAGTGSAWTISNLTSDRTYYVAAYNGPCEGPDRRKVNVFVEPQPIINGSGSAIFMGEPVTLRTSLPYDTYTWKNAAGNVVAQGAAFQTTVTGSYTVTVTKSGVAGMGTSLPFAISNELPQQKINYVDRNMIQDGLVFDPEAVSVLNVKSNSRQVDYFDGLGAALQRVSVLGSPAKNDVVLPIVYDPAGRQHRTYQPVAPETKTGLYKPHAEILNAAGDYIGIAANFYGAGSANKIADDSKPYAQLVFEPGPGQRVMKQGLPGEAWQPDGEASTVSSDHTIKYSYEVNDVADVLLFNYVYPTETKPSGSVQLLNPALHPVLQLFRGVTRDEHGSYIEEYSDKSGRVVLKKVQAGENEYAQTYYVHDDFGQLTHVLQPEATAAILRELSPCWRTASTVGVSYGSGGWTDPIIKKADATSEYGTAGVFSEKTLAAGADGWVEMAATENNTSRMIGLATANADNGVNIQYAVEFRNDALIYAWESGTSRQLLGKYTKGTVVRVSREGTAIRYYVDGRLRYTSATASSGALSVDGALKEKGATLTNVTCSFSLDVNLETILNNYAFRYSYDIRGRMVQKKLPGVAPVYIVYDLRDRVILTQDGNQRAKNAWHFAKYDALNRPILTGVMDTTVAVTRELMQSVVTRHFEHNAGSERFVGNVVDNMFGYTNNAYPVYTSGGIADSHKYWTVNYYDSYDYRAMWVGDYDYHTDGLKETINGIEYKQPTDDEELSMALGQATGNMVRVLDEDSVWRQQSFTWLKTAVYYDMKQRVVQTVSDNYRGGVDRHSSLYDFPGKILYTRLTHTTANPTWTDVVGVRQAGNRLFRNIINTTWGQSGVASQEILAPGQDGWVEFTASEIGTARMLGLSEHNENANYPSIGYALYLRADGALVVRQGTQELKVIPSGFKPGDVLRIARKNADIRYYRNGTEVYPAGQAIPAQSTGPLLVDIAFSTRYGTLANIRSSFSMTKHEVNRRYVYDHAGRLTELYHSLGHGNDATEVLLAKNTYNELGQLVDKGLHSVSGSTAQQSVDYRYNIRGWLTSINNAALNTDESNDESDDYFGMNLTYNAVDEELGNTPLYNGSISGATWSNNLGLSPVTQKGYTYGYDAMNRLVSSVYHDRTAVSPTGGAWQAYTDGQYAERDIQYDLNGNILQLKRNDGRTGGTMDLLTYDYGVGTARGNRLLKVTDAGDKTVGFAEAALTGYDYTYDANGNMTRDLNRKIGTGTTEGIHYNMLNLPDKVTKGENTVRYIYDAQGSKLMQQVDYSSVTTQTDYMGEFVYENSALQFIHHEEGRVVMAKAEMMYTNDADDLSEVTAQNATLSAVTMGAETYIKAVATSTARPGIFPVGNSIAVHAGERYKIRAKAYRLKTHAINLLIQVNGNDLGWPGAWVPIATTTDGNEYWIEQEVKVPEDGELVAGIVGNISIAVGEELFLNAFEIIKQEDSAPEYQYFMKNHLGNVCLTFTSTPEASRTFFTDFEAEDDGTFENYTHATYDLVDHTDAGATQQDVQALNGGVNGRVGVAKAFAVMPGDVISVKAYGKYMNVRETANTNTLVTSLGSAFGVSATSIGDQLAVYEGLNSYAGLVVDGDHLDDDDLAPKAFATILFFDKDHNLVNAAWDQMTTAGAQTSGEVKQLSYDELSVTATVSEAGYAYVFLSNEHPTFVDVYYDDVTIMHTPSAIIAMDDYYAFGMNFNSIARQDGVAQRYLYNGKEKQDELALGWLDYGARMYMPEIGKFTTLDPQIGKFFPLSGYSYVANNPVLLPDVNGEDWTIEKKENKDGSVKYNATFKGAVVNSSSNKKLDLIKFASSLATQATILFGGPGERQDKDVDFSVDIDVKIRAIDSKKDLAKDEHLFEVVEYNDNRIESDDPSEITVAKAVTGKHILVSEMFVNDMTAGRNGKYKVGAHEMGHTAGLRHPEQDKDDYLFGLITIEGPTFNSPPRNFMRQYDANDPIGPTKVQLDRMYRLYKSGHLNKNTGSHPVKID